MIWRHRPERGKASFLWWSCVLLGFFWQTTTKVSAFSSFHSTTEFTSRINTKIFFCVLPIKCVISFRLRRRYKLMILFVHLWENYISIAIIQYGKKNNVPLKTSRDLWTQSCLTITIPAVLGMFNTSPCQSLPDDRNSGNRREKPQQIQNIYRKGNHFILRELVGTWSKTSGVKSQENFVHTSTKSHIKLGGRETNLPCAL